VLTNQNTAKKVGFKIILIFTSKGEFPLIIISPSNTHMHHPLLGINGVFFGVGSFWVRYYSSGPTEG
jgi:hypothetical protein